ncbi:MAG: hypothetical protein KH396_07980 [Atopobiaceae bacterium]|nr:hypothetical protein [Atopobiaceae bacterium]
MRRAKREVADLAEPASGEAGDARWTFWLHCASEGRKTDAWAADPRVALELDVPAGVVSGDYSCAYSYAYERNDEKGQSLFVISLTGRRTSGCSRRCRGRGG